MPNDALTDSLAAAIANHLTAGRWQVQVVAGGPALDKADAFLRGFDIEPTAQTVIVVCDRMKDPHG